LRERLYGDVIGLELTAWDFCRFELMEDTFNFVSFLSTYEDYHLSFNNAFPHFDRSFLQLRS